MTGVVISSAARTAVGSYGKSLDGVPPTDLGATAVTSALERAQTAPDMVDQVVFGNVIHTAPEDMYTARVVGMKAGIPKESPAFTVNRLCGTGVQAIVSATQAIQADDADCVVAGGAESMSRGPYWMPAARFGARMGETKMVDPVVGGLTDPFDKVHMGITAENLAESHSISRERQDEFALESHRRAEAAIAAGRFEDEIEEVDFLKASRRTGRPRGGANFGWSVFEGRRRFRPGAAPGHVPPLIERFHRSGSCSITGGYVIRDRSMGSLRGAYVYGDLCDSRLRIARIGSGRLRGGRLLGLGVPQLVSFGEDARGRVYAVSLEGGVFRLAPRR